MPENFNGPVNISGGPLIVDRYGFPSIGGESLTVNHGEDGVSPAVTFSNFGGGHFLQRFIFGNNSNLPEPDFEAASLRAHWSGLTVAAHNDLSFVIGRRDAGPQMQITAGSVAIPGDLTVGGDIRLSNADCAEEFEVLTDKRIEPGTVMIIDQEGKLRQSERAYDKRAAGVVSGAGDFRPAVILHKTSSKAKRVPVALLGKVFCKADAQYSPIEVGDLLTTSQTPGHAMKAMDPLKAFGSVIGKALSPLKHGQGLIPILVALQ